MPRERWGCVLRAVWIAAALGSAGVARGERPPLRLAVMDFSPAATSAELAPLGAGLQSMITTDLSGVPGIVLVERARLKDIQAELALAETGAVDQETAAKIGGLAGASHLLVGSFTAAGGRMRLDARLFAVATGEVAFGEKIEGAEAAFFELEKQLVKRVVDAVGVRLGRKERAELARPATTNLEAFKQFSLGLTLFDDKKVDAAIAAMQAAVVADPAFALAAARLADFRAFAATMPKPEAPPPPEAQSCRPNPMWAGPCMPEPGAPPSPPTSPMVFGGGEGGPVGITVRAGGLEASCVTPCQLHLPGGPVDLEVTRPVRYRQTLEVPAGPASVTVSTRNRTNLIVGAVLASLTVGMIAATVAIHEAPTTSTSYANQYWPVTLSLATGMAFPAVFYLLKIGKNGAKVSPLMTPR